MKPTRGKTKYKRPLSTKPKEATEAGNELLPHFEQADSQKQLEWKRRARIHPTALNDPERTLEQIEKLSSEHLESFKSLAAAYQKQPNLENYVRLRRCVPDAEIDVALFGGLDPLFALEPHLREHNIDPQRVAGALDAFLPDMDELALRLMECLVAKKKLPKSGPGHLQMRRDAISEALVDYLIVMMLEATEWNKENAPNHIPSSLIVLIRERLRGAWPDLRKEYLSSQARENAAHLAARYFKFGETISARKLEALTGRSRMTASRWLKDPKFKESLELMRKLLAENKSEKPK